MRFFTIGRALAFALLTGCLATPAIAGQKQCSCQDLQSIQEELKNAEYEAQFFSDMAKKLKAVEDPLIEAHKNPIDPDSDVNIGHRSSLKRTEIMSIASAVREKRHPSIGTGCQALSPPRRRNATQSRPRPCGQC
ncbi:hypothetical protein LGH82_00670 [Mesorhizobium sp. PAMC28654]|uniref:hypothetical protein n=1 Tax=Mesorhizobium sp. PAMC28654 TaxID=2880934 RepID=UPI001D0A467C|nr:hypothetical protein [Mesorhizobium sp. PAMC28654]UDL89964.1 hypothetical protein LGH82_00670 [Mesorhizobium sp. PAMC28654]